MRYEYARLHIGEAEVVNDIACGVGYGSAILDIGDRYTGYDRPGVPSPSFPGRFVGCDFNDPLWLPDEADVSVCFETLEHVEQPERLAEVLSRTSRRAIVVSVPTVPTKHANPHHLHDFAVDDIPPLFEGFTVSEVWEQPDELSHVWLLERP